MLLYSASGRVGDYTTSGVRADSLCYYILLPGDYSMLLYSASGRVGYFTRSGVRPDSLCSHILPPDGYSTFYILPPGG